MSNRDKVRPGQPSSSGTSGQYNPYTSQFPGTVRNDGIMHPADKTSHTSSLGSYGSLNPSDKSASMTSPSSYDPSKTNMQYTQGSNQAYHGSFDASAGSSSHGSLAKHGSHLTAQEMFSSPIKRGTTQATLRPAGSAHQASTQLSNSGNQIIFSPPPMTSPSPNSSARQRAGTSTTPGQVTTPRSARSSTPQQQNLTYPAQNLAYPSVGNLNSIAANITASPGSAKTSTATDASLSLSGNTVASTNPTMTAMRSSVPSESNSSSSATPSRPDRDNNAKGYSDKPGNMMQTQSPMKQQMASPTSSLAANKTGNTASTPLAVKTDAGQSNAGFGLSHPQGYTHTPEVQAMQQQQQLEQQQQQQQQPQNQVRDKTYNIILHDDIVESLPENAKHPDRVRKREEFLDEHELSRVAPVNAKNTYDNDMNPKIGQFVEIPAPVAPPTTTTDATAQKPAEAPTSQLKQLTAALEQLDLRPAPTVQDIFDTGYDSDEEIAQLANRLQEQIIHDSFPHINPPTDPNFRPDYNIGNFLKQVPLVSMLTAEECAIMGGCMRLHRYAPGDIIIRQGDVGRGFYIMKVGLAQVTRYDDDARNARVIDHIYSGEYFGEAALISNSPRGANVIAVRPCEVLFMHRDDFHILFDTAKCPNPVVFTKRAGNNLGKVIEEEDDSKFRSLYELKPPPNKYLANDPEVVEMLVNALRTQAVFTGMEHEHRLALIHHMWFASVQRGTVLIREGDVGDNLYVLMQGKINVYIRGDDGKTQRKVDSFDTPGRCFGELALLYNTPRNATVIAKTDAHLWVLDRITFRRIMRNVTAHGIKKHRMMLRRVPLFESLGKEIMNKLAEATELLSFKDNDMITKQGDKPDGFYFVISGLVHVVRKLEDGASYIVNQLQDGDYFGERALIEKTPRSASVVSVGPVEVGKLDKYVFTNILLEKLNPIFKAKLEIYAFRDQLVREQRRDLMTVSTAMVERQRRRIEILANQHPIYKLERLTRLGFLGKGGYGYVELVQNPDTDETFALKSLYRSHIIRTKSTFNVINEKKLLTKLRSPHIIRLYATFKDSECLYFLLEPCLGGELFTLLRARTTFEDRAARFFAASVLLAIEEMHRQGVVYRDLKPENLLLDANGYVKVTDFGLSKEIYDGRTYTVCGTPHYLAPEVVKCIGHTKAVDLWCLGVLIYEMLAGRPPFYRSGERGDHVKLYKRIAACEYQPSSLFTPEAWDLIQRLLQPHEQHRLGFGGGEAFNDIKNHPWFLGFDWDGLSQRSVRAPIIPFLKTPEDTHNFKKGNPNYVQPGKDMPAEGDQGWDAEF